MAREVIVSTWCDVCLAEDERVDARELSITVTEVSGKPKPRVLALCPAHEAELVTPLLELLEEHGQLVDTEGNPITPAKAKSADKGPKAMSCPVCSHVSPNRTALASHTKSMHGKTLAELEGKPRPWVCPDCGYGSPKRQGLAAHRRSAHGWSVADGWADVVDPFAPAQLALDTEDAEEPRAGKRTTTPTQEEGAPRVRKRTATRKAS